MTDAPGAQRAEDEAAAAHYIDASASEQEKGLFRKQAGLQTVRGLGVSLVIFHHMTGKMTNAAAVFDAFFVISGYLISIRLIMLARTANLRDYFLKFYSFRIRRIFPVAILTLLITFVVANLIYLPNRAHDASVDTVWAFFFMANWHFAQQGVDYFSQGAAASPVLNFWSLSVEEQFYLVWPLVILIASWVAHRRGKGTGVMPVALVIIAVSYSYGWYVSHYHPVSAYYDTFARVWDFGIGALMANVAVTTATRTRSGRSDVGSIERPKPMLVRINARLRNHAHLISWIGVVLFILAMFFTPPLGYPVPSASFGLVGMGIIFYADTLKHDPNPFFAKARPLVWLGDISYSLYAVHFPIVIFAMSYLSNTPGLMYAFDVIASLGAAVLMHHFVEKPFRQSWKQNKAWLAAGGHRTPLMQTAVFGMIGAVLFVFANQSATRIEVPALVSSAQGGDQQGLPQTDPGLGVPGGLQGGNLDLANVPAALRKIALQIPATFSDPNIVPATDELGTALAAATQLGSWPELSNADRIDRTDGYMRVCDPVVDIPPACIAAPPTGVDPAKVVLAYGDSTLLAYWPMLKAALIPHGWTVVLFGLTACPAADVLVQSNSSYDDCTRHHAALPGVLAQWHPRMVFLSSAEHSDVQVMRNGKVLPTDQAVKAYEDGLARTISIITGTGARSMILSPPPGGYPLSICDVAGSSPKRCLHSPFGTWYVQNRSDRVVATRTGQSYADLVSFFCHDLVCPLVVNDVAVRSDSVHMTPEYAAMLGASFERYLINQRWVQ